VTAKTASDKIPGDQPKMAGNSYDGYGGKDYETGEVLRLK